MKIKRAISMVLSMVLLTSCIVGCGSTEDETKDTEPTVVDNTVPMVVDNKFDTPDIAPQNFGGRGFNILYASGGVYCAHEIYFFSDGENGDILNDAIYKRNREVEEALNIKINGVTHGDIDTIYPSIKTSSAAESMDYDLALTHTFADIPNMVYENLIYNWNDVPNVDLTKNYWNQHMNDTLAINGFLPVAKSEYMPPEVFLILFNKQIQDDYQLEDYYQVVRDGKWTLDYFIQEAKKVSDDINGDGEYDVNDKYGFCSMLDAEFQAFFTGCNFYSVAKTDKGFEITQPNEVFLSTYNKLYDLLYNGNYTYTYSMLELDSPQEMKFENNHTLFYVQNTTKIDSLRSMKTDFGILPFPKYNTQQENYRTLSMSGFIAIPVCAGDVELSGMASEYLAYKSAEIFTPVYYDVLLGSKYIRDDESSEMLDIIFENIVFDPAMTYGGVNEISYSAKYLLNSESENVTSFFAKVTKSIQKTIYDKIYKAFMNITAEK